MGRNLMGMCGCRSASALLQSVDWLAMPLRFTSQIVTSA